MRSGKATISESYATDQEGEIFLINSYIPQYLQSSYNNHDPKRHRKLLLKKKEISKLIGKVNRDGYSIVPTKIYFNKKGNVEGERAKGKKNHDKRETKKNRDWNRGEVKNF